MPAQVNLKSGLILATSLLLLTSLATPARAHHGGDIVLPLIAGAAIGAWWYDSHHDHYYRHGYRYKRYGYYRNGPSGHPGYRKHGHKRHSYSYGGQYRKKHGHYPERHRYSTSRGGHYRYGRKH